MTEPTTQTLVDINITELIARLEPFVHGLGMSILRETADVIEAQALDLDVQAGSIEAVQAANQRLASELDALRAQVITLETDAERWRWLDASCYPEDVISIEWAKDCTLIEFVDAARTQQAPKGGE